MARIKVKTMAKKKSKKAKSNEKTVIAAAAAAGLALVTGVAAVLLGRRGDGAPRKSGDQDEHIPTDLAGDGPHPGPDDRAPVAFRPDMDAPMSAAEREAMRPATIGTPPRDPDMVEQL